MSDFDIRKTGKDQYDSDTFVDDISTEESVGEWQVSLDTKDIVAILLRLVICVSGILALMFWEDKQIKELQIKRRQVQTEGESLKSKKSEIEKEIKGFNYVAGKSEEFMKRITIMQDLAKVRSLAINGLDQIQDVLPEKVWLEKVSFRDGKFTIDGIALNNTEIQSFIKNLEGSPVFSTVVLSRSNDVTTGQKRIQSNKKFSIESVLKIK